MLRLSKIILRNPGLNISWPGKWEDEGWEKQVAQDCHTQVGRFGAQRVLEGAPPQKGDVGREQSLRVPKTAPGASQAPRAGRLIPFTGSSGTSTSAKKAATLDPTALALGELLTPQLLVCCGRGYF